MSLQIYDTMAGEKRPFEPLEPGKIKMYVCGITPYARSHIGHARCYTAYDIIYRYLQFAGFEVLYVRNFTDVDDKIIATANEEGIDPLAFAQRYIDTFYEDMDALGIARPDIEPRVSTTIDEIIALIEQLEARGIAYAVDGDVFYAVEKFDGYGKLGKRSIDDLLVGARVEENPKKRNPLDFALWKSAKPGEPTWDSPWGAGRPGWHIECSAMSTTHLGVTFDLHGGGRDLVFPHHENEIAQSEGASGTTCARFWTHNGFVNIDDEKMGKSLGNAFNVADLFERYEPEVVRWFLLSAAQYRAPINFTDGLLDDAACRVAYLYETIRRATEFIDANDNGFTGPLPGAETAESLVPRFREALDDDFNVPRAVDPCLEAFRVLNELLDTRKAKAKPAAAAGAKLLLAQLRRIDEVFTLLSRDPDEYLAAHRTKAAMRKGITLEWVSERIGARVAAREARDWGAADTIRDELKERGVVLMDRPEGTDWTLDDTAACLDQIP